MIILQSIDIDFHKEWISIATPKTKRSHAKFAKISSLVAPKAHIILSKMLLRIYGDNTCYSLTSRKELLWMNICVVVNIHSYKVNQPTTSRMTALSCWHC